MKQAWCLAASSTDATAKQLTSLYGRRWGIECTLRDTKDLRFGMGLGASHGSRKCCRSNRSSPTFLDRSDK
jgi:Transposase DDE domain